MPPFAARSSFEGATIVAQLHPAVGSAGLTLTYGSASDSGGGYAGLDRFGRMVDRNGMRGTASLVYLGRHLSGICEPAARGDEGMG